MNTLIQYVVADEQNVYANASTRKDARTYLKTVKQELGKTAAKIYQQEFVLLSEKQVR
jgi:hypothetical protein